MSSADEETVREILLQNNYENPERTLEDVQEAIKVCPGLKQPALNDFVSNNRAGKRIPLLSLTGSIPIIFKGSSYDLPVVIWLPTNYPVGEPQVFLTPTKPITVFTDDYNSYQSIGQDGKVDLSDCQGKKISRNLVELIDQLRIALIRSRPANFLPPGPPLSFPNIGEDTASPSMRMPYRLPKNKSDIKEMLGSNQYTNPTTTAYDISDVICDFEKLEPFLSRYDYNNGLTEVLMCLAGAMAVKKVLPVFSPPYRSFRSAGPVYDVPVLIWIPKEYPNANPIVFVQFTKRLPLTPDPWYFDEHGHLDWKKAVDKYGSFYPKGSPLLKLMDLLTNSRYGLLSLAVGKVGEESTGSSSTSADDDFDIYENIEDSDDTAATIKTTEDCSSDPLQNDVTGTVYNDESSEQTQTCFSTDGDSNSKIYLCQICDAPAEDGKEASDEANQLITLCKQMIPMNQEDIPKKELFRLCVSCKELTKEHWDCEARMETIKAIIEKKAVNAVIETGGSESQLDTTVKPIMNLRNVIFEGYHIKMEKQESLAADPQNAGRPSSDVERDSANIFPVSDILPKDEPVVKVEVEEQLICCAEEQKFFDPLFEEEHNAVKVEIKSEDVEARGRNRSNPSLNAPVSIPQRRTRSTSVRTPKGTLLVEVEGASIKICWTRCTSTNEALLECTFSNCDYSVPVRKTKDEMNEAYRSMKEHVQETHKEEAERLGQRFGKQEHFKCPYHPICKLEFVDCLSVDKHEVVHRTCALCGKKFGKTTFYKNPSMVLSHKCTQKAKKRNAPGKGNQETYGNKKSKNVLKSKNMVVGLLEDNLEKLNT